MDDDVAWQIAEHTFGAVIWILRYIKRNKLPVADDPTFATFEFHVARLKAIFEELDAPLLVNPMLSDVFIRPHPSDEDSTAPNVILPATKRFLAAFLAKRRLDKASAEILYTGFFYLQ